MRILVVDDEPLIVDILRRHLESAGHEVTVASDGQQALDEWDNAHYDGLVSDIKLPKLSGVELLRKIRAGGGRQPCLLISGHVDPALLSAEPHLHPVALLDKPFTFDEFNDAIGTLLGA